jgi:serine/threonine protein kinase
VLGTPTAERWPGVDSMPDYQPIFPRWRPVDLVVHFPQLSIAGVDFVSVRADYLWPRTTLTSDAQRMLVFDPTKRISAKAALFHPYLSPPSASASSSDASLAPPPSTPLSSAGSLLSMATGASSASTAPSSPVGPPSSPCSGLMASPM